jgi:type IV secretion system protein VirB1
MLPGMELMGCTDLAVPGAVMQHVVQVESSRNPYAIGVVGGRLARAPRALDEAVATAKMLEEKGYNFSLGLGQVNRYNLEKYGLPTYEKAFDVCPNLVAASKILAECYSRSGGDWGKSFSCYYSGNFETGFRHGYVQKIYASMRQTYAASGATPIPVISESAARAMARSQVNGRRLATELVDSIVSRRISEFAEPQQTASVSAAPVYPAMPGGPIVSAQSVGPAVATGAAPMPVAPAQSNDLYVIQATGQGKGVAVPAGSLVPSVTSGAPAAGAMAASPQIASPTPTGDGAFVF